MFPIYQSLYKHLPPLFPPFPGPGNSSLGPHANSSHKVDPSTLMDGNLFMAAAAAAMEQVAAASKLEPSSQQSQHTEEESLGSPSPPVDHRNQTSELILPSMKSARNSAITTSSKTPFLKFSVSAILSKAKEEIQEDEAVKSSEGESVIKCIWLCFGYVIKFLMLIWNMVFVFHKSMKA